jgi:hypothetical protein
MNIFNGIIIKSFSILYLLLLFSCSSSTGSRYGNEEKNNKSNSETKTIENVSSSDLKEDFDITPYKTKIIIPEKKIIKSKGNDDIWFDYNSPEIENKPKSLVGTVDGYRVLVLTTDNIEEANQIKADVYFSKNVDDVYVDFEPPFYKVKVGDFELQKSADDLKFKLNQLGYKEAKVIKDKINIFK